MYWYSAFISYSMRSYVLKKLSRNTCKPKSICINISVIWSTLWIWLWSCERRWYNASDFRFYVLISPNHFALFNVLVGTERNCFRLLLRMKHGECVPPRHSFCFPFLFHCGGAILSERRHSGARRWADIYDRARAPVILP